MSSLIPGYTYDIFISYRQKDNKHDGWVTEFVNNLKGELESTFKEEISVYFDTNPHDGLLETHDVNASLKEKLKCLIFIPIISRTYCDPKSYAWEHEFKPFVEQASQYQFGLKVKLPNGNVANRILPIQIHELHPEDKVILERELGGVLRAIEFIYREPGVNKPLTANDNEKKNLNNTTYRIQINKVANAIDELIHSLKGKQPTTVVRKLPSDQTYHNTEEDKSKELSGTSMIKHKSKKWLIIMLSVALCVIGAFSVFKIIEGSKKANDVITLEKSIAVLPFKLLSDEPDKQYLADGMMDAITLHLSKIKDLRVMSRTSVEQYRGTTKTTHVIGKELAVEYLLEGSFQKYGDNVKLIVQLIKTKEESHAWGDEYNNKWSEVFSLQSVVAQKIASELNAVISPEEKQQIEKIPTSNLNAYDLYLRGDEEEQTYWNDTKNRQALERAEKLYNKTLEYDSTFALAYSGLAGVYLGKHGDDSYFFENYLDSMLILLNIAISYDDHLADAYYNRGNYYVSIGKSEKAKLEYEKAIEYNPNFPEANRSLGNVYLWDKDYSDYIKGLEYLLKATGLMHGRPLSDFLRNIGDAYGIFAGFPEKAKGYYQEALQLDGDTTLCFITLAVLEMNLGNSQKAIELINQVYARDSNRFETNRWMTYIYSLTDLNKESLKCVKNVVERYESLSPFSLGSVRSIGYVYWMNGYKQEAEHWFDKQKRFCELSIRLGRGMGIGRYDYYELAAIYAFLGEKQKAYDNLNEFAKIHICPLGMLTSIKTDPFFNSIRKEPEFQKIVTNLEFKYQAEHERVRKWLEENKML
jgi:TolB-like protein